MRSHAVTTAGSASFSYDANGNMPIGNGRTYTWGGMNRPPKVVVNGIESWFLYGSGGTRVKKTTRTTPRGCTAGPGAPPVEETTYVFGDERVAYWTSPDPRVPTTLL